MGTCFVFAGGKHSSVMYSKTRLERIRRVKPYRITLATTRGAMGGCPRTGQHSASHAGQSCADNNSSRMRTSCPLGDDVVQGGRNQHELAASQHWLCEAAHARMPPDCRRRRNRARCATSKPAVPANGGRGPTRFPCGGVLRPIPYNHGAHAQQGQMRRTHAQRGKKPAGSRPPLAVASVRVRGLGHRRPLVRLRRRSGRSLTRYCRS